VADMSIPDSNSQVRRSAACVMSSMLSSLLIYMDELLEVSNTAFDYIHKLPKIDRIRLRSILTGSTTQTHVSSNCNTSIVTGPPTSKKNQNQN